MSSHIYAPMRLMSYIYAYSEAGLCHLIFMRVSYSEAGLCHLIFMRVSYSEAGLCHLIYAPIIL